jgi:hypothetical protein
VNGGPVCIELKRGDTLDLGDDNKFHVISLDPADEYDKDKDDPDDVDEGREEDDVDRDNEDDKADVKKPPPYPKRPDGEDNEEPFPPTASKADTDADANEGGALPLHTLPRPMPKPT